jgi:hypothetical protein
MGAIHFCKDDQGSDSSDSFSGKYFIGSYIETLLKNYLNPLTLWMKGLCFLLTRRSKKKKEIKWNPEQIHPR